MASSDRPGSLRLNEEDCRKLAVAADAVGAWADFPFDAVPRPVVLTGEAVQVERGFATGEAKHAFLQGAIEADETVPAEPVRALRREPQLTGAPARSRLRVTCAFVDQTAFATNRRRRSRATHRAPAPRGIGSWPTPPPPPTTLYPHLCPGSRRAQPGPGRPSPAVSPCCTRADRTQPADARTPPRRHPALRISAGSPGGLGSPRYERRRLKLEV